MSWSTCKQQLTPGDFSRATNLFWLRPKFPILHATMYVPLQLQVCWSFIFATSHHVSFRALQKFFSVQFKSKQSTVIASAELLLLSFWVPSKSVKLRNLRPSHRHSNKPFHQKISCRGQGKVSVFCCFEVVQSYDWEASRWLVFLLSTRWRWWGWLFWYRWFWILMFVLSWRSHWLVQNWNEPRNIWTVGEIFSTRQRHIKVTWFQALISSITALTHTRTQILASITNCGTLRFYFESRPAARSLLVSLSAARELTICPHRRMIQLFPIYATFLASYDKTPEWKLAICDQ